MTNEQYEELKVVVKTVALAYFSRVAAFMTLDDLVSEGWVAALEAVAKNKSDSGTSLVTFVYPAIHWRLTNIAKRQRFRRNEVSLDAPLNDGEDESGEPNTLHDVIGAPPDQDESVILAEFRNELMRRFPKRTVDIIYMRVKGVPYAEISDALGVSEEAARKTFSRVYSDITGKAAA